MRRWMTFNGIGVLGLGVQLSVLAGLVELAGWHAVAATAVAVEAAILHNFVWHQRLTWRDRPVRGAAAAVARLWRFHALNGFISLGGNVAIVAALTTAGDVHPVVASLGAVIVCSLLNYVGSDRLVFKATATALVVMLLPAVAGASPAGEAIPAAELKPHTVAAWQKYEKVVDARHAAANQSGEPFFAHDAFGRRDWRRRVIEGEVSMLEAERASPDAPEIDVPDGRIHHWVGAMFVPDTTVDAVIARLQANAGRESDSYEEVVESRLIARDGPRLRVFMRIQRDATITTVTYNTEHDVEYRMLGTGRAIGRSTATRIAEVEHAGRPDEREKPIGNDSGYLWRWNAYWRYQEVDGGVLIECESVSLSRGVPLVIRPIVNPIASRLARESLRRTLTTLRSVLSGQETPAGR